MNEHPHYFDPDATEPEPVNVALTEDETRRVYRIAEGYAALCEAHGYPPPPDAMRALLQCCEHLEHILAVIRAAHDKAVLDAESPGSIQ